MKIDWKKWRIGITTIQKGKASTTLQKPIGTWTIDTTEYMKNANGSSVVIAQLFSNEKAIYVTLTQPNQELTDQSGISALK